MANYSRDKLEFNSKANDNGIKAGASMIAVLMACAVKAFCDRNRDRNRNRDDQIKELKDRKKELKSEFLGSIRNKKEIKEIDAQIKELNKMRL